MKMRTFWLATLAAAVTVLAGAAAAQVAGGVNSAIDAAQVEFVKWLAGAAASLFMGVLTWFGTRIGIKVIEYFNRDAVARAVNSFGNQVIDDLQERYLTSSNPDLSDLIERGIDYVQGGNAEAVKQNKYTDDRLVKIVTGALKAKGVAAAAAVAAGAPAVADLDALRRAGTAPAQ